MSKAQDYILEWLWSYSGGSGYSGGAGILLLLFDLRVFEPTIRPFSAPGAKLAHNLAQVILAVGECTVVQVRAISTLK